MEQKNRRQIFGSLGALLAAPFLLGRREVAEAALPDLQLQEAKASQPLPRIEAPALSVKRRD